MGKIVKYCAACEEGFAEKFVFCPNCGAGLTAYAMNPVTQQSVEDKASDVWTRAELSQPEVPPTQEFKSPEIEAVPETPAILAEDTQKITQPIILEPLAEAKDAPGVTKIERTEEQVAAAVPETVDFNYEEVDTQPAVTQEYRPTESFATVEFKNYDGYPSAYGAAHADDTYNPTIVKESGGPVRQFLLLGAFMLVLTASLVGIVYSLFNANPWVSSLEESELISFVPPLDPEQMEPETPEPKNKDKGGGGGGGGKEEPTPTSKGQIAPQMEKPLIPPSAKIPKLTNPDIKITPATEGNNRKKVTDEQYGDPNSAFTGQSDGMGSGGGQGSGQGRGQGSGRGTGQGSGVGSGSGSGVGSGNGSGTGPGDNGGDPPPVIRRPPPTPKPTPVGVTEGIKIISKPKAPYTDAARQNQVQGTVTLRVTFLSSGQVGGVSPVSGLPYGLTEQAIAAAKRISFEPAKSNGVPQTVTKQVQYVFTLY